MLLTPVPGKPLQIVSKQSKVIAEINKDKQNNYLFVNYTNDKVVQINENTHHIPLLKQQENLKDYLYEVAVDTQRQNHLNCLLKDRYFRLIQDRLSRKKKSRVSPKKVQKQQHFDPIQFIDDLEYKSEKRMQKEKLMNFSTKIDSVKFISSDSLTHGFPKPIQEALLKQAKLSKTQQYANSIQDLLNRSERCLQQQKKSFISFKSQNELNRQNKKIIKSERRDILTMIKRQKQFHSQEKSQPDFSYLPPQDQLKMIPNKQRYSLDFLNYNRTKNKIQLDKYVFEQKIRKPQKNLQKFQDFILKQVKFSTEHKDKLERFFIKMKDEFRRVQGSKKAERGLWRSKSIKNEKKQIKEIEQVLEQLQENIDIN